MNCTPPSYASGLSAAFLITGFMMLVSVTVTAFLHADKRPRWLIIAAATAPWMITAAMCAATIRASNIDYTARCRQPPVTVPR